LVTEKLGLFDWKKLQAKGDWIFANRYQEIIDDKKQDYLIFMIIRQDGSFEFEKVDPWESITTNHKYNKYNNYIQQVLNEEKKPQSVFRFEGFITSEDGDINLLFNTDEITIPQLEDIKTIIEQVDQPLSKNYNTGNDLAELIEEFINDNVQTEIMYLPAFAKLDDLMFSLQEIGDNDMDKISFRKLLTENIKGKGSKIIDTALRNYLVEKYKIRLHFSKDFVSNPESRELFEALFDIKYYEQTEREAYYSVGVSKNVEFSFKDACHIRKIVAVEGSKLIFQELLKTMDVDFVRTGQSTVIPFPFKYIREYQNLD
jgi:hypothetical protein